jgi:hypothetical protein
MTDKAKLIRTIYLYLAALISLIFVAVGVGRIFNSGLKYMFFPEAEKKSYYECTNQPPVYASETAGVEKLRNSDAATDDQKKQLDNLLKDYENWKENSSGEKCIAPARQNGLVDAFTMVIIALPICLIHWRIIKKDKEVKENEE